MSDTPNAADWYVKEFQVTAIAKATAGPAVESPITAEEIESRLEEALEGLDEGFVVDDVEVREFPEMPAGRSGEVRDVVC
jgi:hypothetical protein